MAPAIQNSPDRIFKAAVKRRLKLYAPLAVAAFAGVFIAVAQKPSTRNLIISALVLIFLAAIIVLFSWIQSRLYPGNAIELYRSTDTLKFRGYRFKTKFLPEPALDEVDIRLSEILDISILSDKGQEIGFKLRTLSGVVTVTSALEGYDDLKAELFACVEKTRLDHLRYSDLLRLAPSFGTPWYAWLFFVFSIAGSAYSIYYFGMR